MTHPLPLAATLTAADLESLSVSADNAVREAVARHPNTPPEVLGMLGEYHPQAVLNNPALTLLRLAHPGLLGGWSGETVAGLAALPDAPAWVQDTALRHEDLLPRLAVASRADLSEHRMRNLACNAMWQLREAMARRPGLMPELVEMLALDDDYDVRKAVAAREALPPELVQRLSEDSHAFVRSVVARRLDLPLAQMQALAADEDPDVQASVARRHDIPVRCAKPWRRANIQGSGPPPCRRGRCQPPGTPGLKATLTRRSAPRWPVARTFRRGWPNGWPATRPRWCAAPCWTATT